MEILFKSLSAYAGRRQYKIIPEISKYIPALREAGIDWHTLKSMDQVDLLELFSSLQLNHAERSILLTALQKKICGVLCESSTRHSNKICFREGVYSHGWRCGQEGHFNDVFFEGKSSVPLLQYKNNAIKCRNDSGVCTIVKDEPDLSVIGRFHDTIHPRVWRTPENPIFKVDLIGYEFRVHPNDPRVKYQIEGASSDWEMHAEITKQIIWEMLEMHATERDPQPLFLKPGEMGSPDSCLSNSRAFAAEVWDNSSNVSLIEYKMTTKDGREVPWFMNPLPQKFENGIPVNLPFAPSIVLKSSFKQLSRSLHSHETEKLINQPVMDISIFIHPKACFFWNAEDEQKCIRQILDYSKKIPYALPFYLYFRIDSSRHISCNPQLQNKKNQLLKNKKCFDLQSFSIIN